MNMNLSFLGLEIDHQPYPYEIFYKGAEGRVLLTKLGLDTTELYVRVRRPNGWVGREIMVLPIVEDITKELAALGYAPAVRYLRLSKLEGLGI